MKPPGAREDAGVSRRARLLARSRGTSGHAQLLALKGAATLEAMALPSAVTIAGIIVLTAVVDLLIGSASTQWALLAPILVAMLMSIGISPELTQAAYRVGDSVTNIITPLMVFSRVAALPARGMRHATTMRPTGGGGAGRADGGHSSGPGARPERSYCVSGPTVAQTMLP
ncbi:AbgT family transporter [Sorangium sp. So ce1151]